MDSEDDAMDIDAPEEQATSLTILPLPSDRPGGNGQTPVPESLYHHTTKKCYFRKLPNDIFTYVILPNIDSRGRRSFGLTCRRMYDLQQTYATQFEPYPTMTIEDRAYSYDSNGNQQEGITGALASRLDGTTVWIRSAEATATEDANEMKLVPYSTVRQNMQTDSGWILEMARHELVSPTYYRPGTSGTLTYKINWVNVVAFLQLGDIDSDHKNYQKAKSVRLLVLYYLKLSPMAHFMFSSMPLTYRDMRSDHYFLFKRIEEQPQQQIVPMGCPLVALPPFLEPESITLFDYQRSSVDRLRRLESRVLAGLSVGTVDQYLTFTLTKQNLYWDSISSTPKMGPAPKETNPLFLYSRGFFLSDGTGLGKTTTSLALALGSGPLVMPPHMDDDVILPIVTAETPVLIAPTGALPVERLNLFYTRASVVYIKKELLIGPDAWLGRAKRLYPNKMIVVLSTRAEYMNTSYMDIACADLVIVTSNLLMGLVMDTAAILPFNTGGASMNKIHPANLAPDYMASIRPEQTCVHLGLFLWQRLFVDEAHELVNKTMPSEHATFLSNFSAAYVRYHISATPWDQRFAHPNAQFIQRIFGDFLGLYVAPADPIHSIQTLRKETVKLLVSTYTTVAGKEKKEIKEPVLTWTRTAKPPTGSRAEEYFTTLRPFILGHAISMACRRALVTRNTEGSVVKEVSLANVKTTSVKVPVHELFFILDDEEAKLGCFDGLNKYVCHTKTVHYEDRETMELKVDTKKNQVICTPARAVENLAYMAQELVSKQYSYPHRTSRWNPVTRGKMFGVNERALGMDAFITKTFGPSEDAEKPYPRLPQDTRHGPFPLFAAQYVKRILDASPDRRVIMATKHRVLIKALTAEFIVLGESISVLGSSNLATAKKHLNAFNDSTRVMVLLAIEAAAGLNLQIASHLILLDDPASINQAELKQLVGRLQRPGQKLAQVEVIHLIPERVTAGAQQPPQVVEILDEEESRSNKKRKRQDDASDEAEIVTKKARFE